MEHERFKIIPVVAAIIEDDHGRLLMVREAKPEHLGLWNQPAGHVDPNEGVEEALLREVAEETGYVHARIDGILRIYYFVDENMLRMVFKVSVLDDERIPLADDVLEARWFTRSEIEEMMHQGKLRNRRTVRSIQDWIAGIESAPATLIQTIK